MFLIDNNLWWRKMSFKIEFNKVYKFDFTDKVIIGDLPVELLHSIMRDGRVASKFLEHHLPIWFPDLKFVDQNGYDHTDKQGNQYDLKGFTKGGANYAPSYMIGYGRKVNESTMQNHAKYINYVLSDIVEFPKVNIIFKRGIDLIKSFPTGKIPFKHRKFLFNL